MQPYIITANLASEILSTILCEIYLFNYFLHVEVLHVSKTLLNIAWYKIYLDYNSMQSASCSYIHWGS